MLQPIIRLLYLVAVFDLLFEHAVAITNAAAVGIIIQRGKRIQKTGCQSPQSSISQRRIRLLILYEIDVDADFL